jgi:hypothetical protein
VSLRQACQGAGVSKAALDIRWPQLSQTARSITSRWADRPERKPPTFQLDTIVHSVRHAWQAQKSLAGLSSREIRWLPHAIFHPEAKRDAWLAHDVTFMTAALSSMSERGRAVRSLLRNMIRLWPKDLATAQQIQSMLNMQLRTATSPRLQEWRRRVDAYGLLSLDGPRNFVDLLRADPKRRTQVLEDAGLVGDLAQSAFLVEVNRSLAYQLWEHLCAARYQELDPALDLLAPEGQLTFKADAPYVAEALLNPFVQVTPPSKVQEQIRAFLLTHLQDPRLTQSGWTRVRPEAKDVMLRWMVSASLDDFFALIARRAQEEHWRYRKAFWSAYLKRDHIARAWVILGDSAELEALRRWRNAVPAHGRLSGGDPDHCVLMLQIGSLTIVEWSHNGACRLWAQNDKNCPNFYQPDYSRLELRANPGYEQRHHGNVHYTWQQKLAEVIHQETSIRIPQVEYRVR